MAGIFKEREERTEARTTLPHAERVEGLHQPIESLSRSASHMRIHPEATYSSASQADMAATISRNVTALLQVGSAALSSRFARVLEAL